MKKKIEILNDTIRIPAIIWGNTSNKILIEIHGNLSNKEDVVIAKIAKRAVESGYQVISFDLPEHGDRNDSSYKCEPSNCISDLQAVYRYSKSLGTDISVFGCSIGAYFSLLAYKEYEINQLIFLSPVVNMEKIIKNMMRGFDISEERLKSEQRIELPIGQTLDWDYYSFVRDNRIFDKWQSPINILYGRKDMMCEWSEISDFVTRNNADVKIDEDGEHYYHTQEHLETIDQWLDEVL